MQADSTTCGPGMLDPEDAEEKALRLAQEKQELDDAHRNLVKCVLSNTRIDPKYKGQRIEFFKAYEDEVTSEQIKALIQGKYYQAFKYFHGVWRKLPQESRPELYRIVEMINTLSRSTMSMYREIEHTESQSNKTLSDVEILRQAPFLSQYNWGEKTSGFNPDDLSEALNEYLDVGIEYTHVDRSVVKLCTWRAYDEQKAKVKDASASIAEKIFGKLTYCSIFATVVFKIIGWLIPVAIYLGIDLWIIWVSLEHLSGEKFSYWAWVGLGYVAITGIITLIHLGTRGTRKAIEALAKPTAPTSEMGSMNVDLWAMNRAVNTFRQGHINLRLVRDQLARLQDTEIKFPVQLLTLIDRAIAKGVHYW
jgi:hypothetical protein